MAKLRPQIGDIFELLLDDGTKAYVQYVFWDPEMGPAVRVLDLTMAPGSDSCDLHSRLENAETRFGPVFVGLRAAVQGGDWRKVANFEVVNVSCPCFLTVMFEHYVPVGPWRLQCGKETRLLGNPLPQEYRHLELSIGWDSESLKQRIQEQAHPIVEMVKRG
jgi:hypothetical protein